MHADPLGSLVVITAATVLAPLLADWVRPIISVSTVVVELLLGILIGPDGLGLAKVDDAVSLLSEFGLALLMFMAGYEIDFARIRGRPLRMSLLAWLVSFALGLGIGLALARGGHGWLVVGMALCTTALGTILPIVRDAGKLESPFGTRILATGAVGEFGPIVAIALLLGTGEPGRTVVLLVVFVLIALAAAFLASRPTPPRLRRLLSATLGTSVQLAVRLSLFVVVGLLGIAAFFDLDILLGAFTAGIVVRLLIGSIRREEIEMVESKLDAIAFGFLVPIYFVVSGMNFRLRELVSSPGALLALLLFVPAFVVVRGIPTFLAYRSVSTPPETRALALLGATALPLVVAITNTGVAEKQISPVVAASLVGAAMISVLVFPVLALRQLRQPPQPREPRRPRGPRVRPADGPGASAPSSPRTPS